MLNNCSGSGCLAGLLVYAIWKTIIEWLEFVSAIVLFAKTVFLFDHL